MITGKLSFFIGAARSGKSTIAREWEATPDPGYPRAVVSPDTIRLAHSGERFNSHTEDLISVVKNLMIRHYLLLGYHVLVDGTHTTENSIGKLLQISRKASPIVVDTPIETCKERALSSGQSDLVGPIDRMFRGLRSLWGEHFPGTEMDLSNQKSWESIVKNISEKITYFEDRIVK